MDKEQRASYITERAVELIKTYYEFCDDKIDIGKLIKETSLFFNQIKGWNISQGILKFLYEMAAFIGLPQYFDMLLKLPAQQNTQCEFGNTNSVLSAQIFESSLVTTKLPSGEFLKLHRYQKEIVDAFIAGQRNRFILTAPTSFGKTFVVPQIMQRMGYQNIVLIFPTLALLTQNFLEITDNEIFADYQIHTLSDFMATGDKNIWIYTPERFLSMTDKNSTLEFDFIFMDEVYKIDNQYLLQDSVGENERDVAYRIALDVACKKGKDVLLAGPFIELPAKKHVHSMNNFINDNGFSLLQYNNIEIVNQEKRDLKENGTYSFYDEMQFSIRKVEKYSRLEVVLSQVNTNRENAIIYCSGQAEAEKLVTKILGFQTFKLELSDEATRKDFTDFLEHIKNNFGDDWVVVKGLMSGVGVHHGYIPKYIQKEIIKYFNLGVIRCLASTTTITEGINTTAKNMIVFSDRKGRKPLKKFDAQNIAGRAGRFTKHYNGRVISINNSFMDILDSEAELLRHKNYDLESSKAEVDFEITPTKYLTAPDKLKKEEIEKRIAELGIPRNLFYQFKSVSPTKKLQIFELMLQYTAHDFKSIGESIQLLHYFDNINWKSFDFFICKLQALFDDNDFHLNNLVNKKTKTGYCALTVLIYNYFAHGYKGLLKYKNDNGGNIDKNIRDTSQLVFNIFRYQLCKYIGVFDAFYTYIIEKKQNKQSDEILGFSLLLQKLEYGATTGIGKQISDYGVPFSVIAYIDTENKQIRDNFDDYEKSIFQDIVKKYKLQQ